MVCSTVCTSKTTSKLPISGLCEVHSPHKRLLTRKMLPFHFWWRYDEVIAGKVCTCFMLLSCSVMVLTTVDIDNFQGFFTCAGAMIMAFIKNMMTSWNGNIFCVTGPLCGEFTGHRWIPRTKASDAEFWYFFLSAWIIGWVNNREAGYLRRHRAHHDVTVMKIIIQLTNMAHYVIINLVVVSTN